MPSLRKGLHNPRHCLERVPSMASSAHHGKGLATSHQTVLGTAPILGQPVLQEWHLHLGTSSHELSEESLVKKTKAANFPMCHSDMEAHAWIRCTNTYGHAALGDTHDESNMHTHVHTHSYLQDPVLHTDERAMLISHTCTSSRSSKAWQCAGSTSHPPRQSEVPVG